MNRLDRIIQQGQRRAAATMPVFEPSPIVGFGLGALDTVGRAVEPLMFLQQLFFAAGEDAANFVHGRTAEGKLLATLADLPTYAPFGARPERHATGETWLRNVFGMEQPPGWLSIATEFVVDPLLFGGWVRGIGMGARALGATGLADDLTKTARALDFYTSPRGMAETTVRGVGQAIGRPVTAPRTLDMMVDAPLKVPESFIMEYLGTKVAQALDTPSVFRRQGIGLKPRGELGKEFTNYTWAEILFPFGRVTGAPLGVTDAIMEAMTRARGKQHEVWRQAEVGANQVAQIIYEVVPSRKVPSLSAGIGARFQRLAPAEGFEGLADNVARLAGGWANDIGRSEPEAVADLLMILGAPRAARTPELIAPLTERVFQAGRHAQKYRERVRKLASTHGITDELEVTRLMDATERAALVTFRTSAVIGSVLSGGENFLRVTKAAAGRIGIDHHDYLTRLVRHSVKPEATPLERGLGREAFEEAPEILQVTHANFSVRDLMGTQREIPARPGVLAALKLEPNIINEGQMAILLNSSPREVYNLLTKWDPHVAGHINPTMRPTEMMEQYGRWLASKGGYGRIQVSAVPIEGAQRVVEDTLADLKPLTDALPLPPPLQQAVDGGLMARATALTVMNDPMYQLPKDLNRQVLEGKLTLKEAYRIMPIRIPEGVVDYSRMAAAFTEAATEMGLRDFITVEPAKFLEGLMTGYSRVLYMGVLHPAQTAEAVAKKAMVPYQHFDYRAWREAFEEAIPGAGQAVADYIASIPRRGSGGVVVTSDLAQALTARLGRQVSAQEVINILAVKDPTYKMAKAIEASLIERTGVAAPGDLAQALTARLKREVSPEEAVRILGEREPGFRMARKVEAELRERAAVMDPMIPAAQYRLRGKAFEERMSEELSMFLVEEQHGVAKLAALGMAAGPAAKAQVFMDEIYRSLQQMNLVFDDVHVGTTQGIRMVTLPKEAETWGAFAGKAVPLVVARELVSLNAVNSLTAWGRFMSAIRAGYLSALPTTIRNVIGNFFLMQQRGIPIHEILPYLRKSHKALQNFTKQGHDEYFTGAEDLLNLFTDGSLSRNIAMQQDETLRNILADVANIDKPGVYEKLMNAYVDVIAKTAPIGFLRVFQGVEDTMRAAVFGWAKDKLLKAGRNPTQAIEEAAFYANRALYDYANISEGVRMLRDSGMALFPSFTYFTVGNVARGLWETPGRLAIQERIMTGASQALLPDEQERDRINRMIHDTHLGEARPIPIPIGNNQYYLLNMSWFLPTGAVSRDSLLNFMLDPMMAGFWRPAIEVAAAWFNGSGEAFATQRFGERVFRPYDTPAERVADTAGFLYRALDPGGLASIAHIAERLPLIVNQEQAEHAATQLDRWLDTDLAQQVARLAGARLIKMDTEGRSARQRSRQIMAEFQESMRVWNADWRRAVATNDLAEIERLRLARQRLHRETQDSLNLVWGQ